MGLEGQIKRVARRPSQKEMKEQEKPTVFEDAICIKIDTDDCLEQEDENGNVEYSFKLLTADFICVQQKDSQCVGTWTLVMVNKYSGAGCNGNPTIEEVWMPLCVQG